MAVTDANDSPGEILDMVPEDHRRFATGILAQHNIDTADVYDKQTGSAGGFLTKGKAANIIDVAFSHPIKLIVNALGVPPQYMLEMGKERGVVVGALVGAKEHAVKQVEAGVDVLIVSGTEAGGHCGEVSTMVLVQRFARQSLTQTSQCLPLEELSKVDKWQLQWPWALTVHGLALCGWQHQRLKPRK